MKTKFTYLMAAFLCLILASCSTNEPPFTLSQNSFTDVPPEGKSLSLDITPPANGQPPASTRIGAA